MSVPSAAEAGSSNDLDVGQYLDTILRRRWIFAAAAMLVIAVTGVFTFTMRPVYRASAMIVIEKERGGAFQTGGMVENSNEDYYQTQYKLLESRTLLGKVYDDLKLSGAPDFAQPHGLEKLARAISIAPIMRSRLVNVRADSHDPKLAAEIANRLSQVFVEENLANQLFISKEVLQALQMKDGRASYESLPAVVSNPLIQTLKGDYAKLQSRYADMSKRYTDKYPEMVALRSNMAALEGQIRGETERIVQSLKTELSGQLKGNNVRIVDSAPVPELPLKPRKKFNMALGLVGGVVFGLGLCFLVETLDQSLRTQEDIEVKLGKPFLGVVPQGVVKTGRVYEAMISKELSLTSEAFRNLRTMVDFAGVGGKAKALVMTSAVQGEGKTYVSCNLAVSLAQLGEKVLLIDGDLRRPSVHRAMSLSSEKGLSDFLLHGRQAEDVVSGIQQCDVPGLSVLTCGPRPPNPSELLNTPRLGALVHWARERYDRVIVDCTPMFPINDTLLWGRHISGGVLIVRYGATRTPLIRNACQKLETGSIKLLGAAVNAVRAGGLTYSSYGYYYQQYYQEYQLDERKTTAGAS